MSQRVEIFVGVVEKVSGPVSKGGATSALVDQFNTDRTGFTLVNQTAQTGAAVAGVISVTKLTVGFVPFLNISTNTMTGTTTFLKIVAEYKSGEAFKSGDYISLIGNVAGVVAGFALLGGAIGLAGGFTAVAIGTTLFGVYDSGLAQSIYNNLISPVLQALKSEEINYYGDAVWVAPDLKLVSVSRISADYTNLIAAVKWDPNTNSVTLDSTDFGAFPDSEAGGVAFGGGSMGPPGVIPQLPDVVGRVDISIATVNGQDQYACCIAPQQDKYR